MFSARALFVAVCFLFKGGIPAAPSGTATLLRLSPNYLTCPEQLLCGHHLQAFQAFMA